MEHVGCGKKIFNQYLRKRFPYVDYENDYPSEESSIDFDENGCDEDYAGESTIDFDENGCDEDYAGESTIDFDENRCDEYYADGMNNYYENNRYLLEADLYSDDSCFEDGSVVSDDSYYYMNSDNENYYDLLLEISPHFEEYNYTTEDSDSYYEDGDSMCDLDSYCEENHDTDEDSDSGCVDNYDSTNDLDPHYEENHGVDEDSEIVCRSNLGAGEIITTNESSVLFLFYVKFLEDLKQNFFVSSSDVRSSIRLLIDCYSLVNLGQLPLEIDFNSMQYCLGYLYRYGACHMALVLEAVSTMLESSHVLLSMLNKKKLNIIFLGGGPCNDLLGFLAALHGHHNLWALDVTVVDKMPGWASVFTETVKRLKRGDFHLAGFKHVNVTPSFITADLKEFYGWCDKMQNKLARSDV
ncbi:hypothetical protein AVEN_263028-1, partial [Araneus ventricosus]